MGFCAFFCLLRAGAMLMMPFEYDRVISALEKKL